MRANLLLPRKVPCASVLVRILVNQFLESCDVSRHRTPQLAKALKGHRMLQPVHRAGERRTAAAT